MKEGSMSKRLSLQFSRVFPSFSPCRPKDPAAAVAPAFALSPVNPKARDIDFPPPPPPGSPARPAALRHLAPVVTASGCRCSPRRPSRRKAGAVADIPSSADIWCPPPKFPDVPNIPNIPNIPSSPRRKIDSDNDSVFDPPPLPPPAAAARRDARRRRAEKSKMMKKWRSRGQVSSSSADSGWFSSEDEENDEREDGDDGDETDTLLSSFETDSSIANAQRASGGCPSPERAAAVLSRLSSVVHEEQVAEGFAVVKRSKDPHGDFRRSMAEMVLEKQIYDAPALEQLLQCFLSLNSRHHHAAIVAAFADVWEAVFPASAVPTPCFNQ